MNCFLSFQRGAAVPISSPPEVSKAASEPALRQYVTSRSAGYTTFVKHGQAGAAFVSAKRHISPALLKRATPQMEHSTILRPRFIYPAAVDVRGFCQQELPRHQPSMWPSYEQHQTLQNPQANQPQQQHKFCVREPSQKESAKKYGAEDHTIYRDVQANNYKNIERQQPGSSLTANGARSQDAQQLLSPAPYGKFPRPTEQQQQLKGDFMRSTASGEKTSYAYQPTQQDFVGADTFVSAQGAPIAAGGPSTISPRNSAPQDHPLPSSTEQPGSPSFCRPQLPRAATASYGTRARPLQPRSFSVTKTGGGTGAGVTLRDKRTVLHFSVPEASGDHHYSRPRPATSSPSNGNLKAPTLSMPEAVASASVATAVGVEQAIPAAGSTTTTGTPLVHITATSNRFAGGEVPSTGADTGVNHPGDALFHVYCSSRTPQPQVGGAAPHFLTQGCEGLTTGKNCAPPFPVQHSGNFAHPHCSCVLCCLLPLMPVLPRDFISIAGTQLHTAAPHLLRSDTERGGTEEETKYLIRSCSGILPQVVGRSHGVEQHQLPASKQPASKLRPNVGDTAAEGSICSAAQQGTGFVLGRPRTPLRAPVPQTRQCWQSPHQPQPLQAQGHAERYSAFQEQLFLQRQLRQLQGQHPYSRAAAGVSVGQGSPMMVQQLRQLQDQRPYSWAATGVSVRHGSPVMVHGNAPKLPFGAGQIHPEQRAQANILPNSLVRCCWRPHSPQTKQTDPIFPSSFSNGTSVVYNQLSCTLSADGATCIQTQGQEQGLQKASMNRLQKRPTSAPPGTNDRRLSPYCTVTQSYQQGAPASTAAVLASRRGIPWKYQLHHVLQQRNDQIGIGAVPLPQSSPLTAATPHLPSSPAFFLTLSETASAASAPAAAAPVAAQQLVEPSALTLGVAGSYRGEKQAPVPAWKDSRQVASVETGADDVSRDATAEQYVASSADAPGTKVPLLTPAEETSPATATTSAATAMVQKKNLPPSLDTNVSLNSASVQSDGARVAVPRESQLRFAGGKQRCIPGSLVCFASGEATEQNEVSTMLPKQNDVVADVGETACKSATPQQHQQPSAIVVSEGDPRGLTTEGENSLKRGREGTLCRVKTTRVEAALVATSAVCGSYKRHQDQLEVHPEYRAQIQQRSNSLGRHLLQHKQWQDQQEQNRQASEQQQQQQLQPWGEQRDPLRIASVGPSFGKARSRSRILQNRESAEGLDIEEIGIHTRTQPPDLHDVQRERLSPSVAFAESSVPFVEPSGVDTLRKDSSLRTSGICTSAGDEVTDNASQTPPENGTSSALHSTSQDAVAGALGAALRPAGSACTSDCVSMDVNVISTSSSRVYTSSDRTETSLVSSGQNDLASRVFEIESLQQHKRDQQGTHVLSSGDSICSNLTPDAAVSIAEADTRTNRSTGGSKRGGLGRRRRDGARRCSQEGSISKTSSCRHTSSGSSRKSCLLRVHEVSGLQERQVDRRGEIREDASGTSVSAQSRNSGKRSGSVCDSAQAGSRIIRSDDASKATAENFEGCGSVGDGRETQVRARESKGGGQRRLRGRLERRLERSRMRSISSTDVSRCTGRCTTTSNEFLGLSEECTSDVDNEGKEDVIPLPSFLWRSPRCLLKNAAGSPSLHIESTCTIADVDIFHHPACRRTTLQCGRPSQNKEETRRSASTTGNCGNDHVVHTDLPGGGNSPNAADMQLEDFELADPRFGGEASLLGRGTYGVVRLMRHKPTGRLYAVKSIEKSSVVEAGMVSQVEFELLTQKDVLRHRNVLRCHAFLEDIDRVHMILEYCSGGDLYTRIRTQPLRRISEQEAFLYFAQLVNGLHYMHTRCIMHRDLKLENLLLDKDGVLKIADLGWCTTILGKRRNFNFCGTLDYLAPEMIRGDGHDWRVDLWGAGILLYEMLDGKPPFQSTRHLELVQQILKAKISLPPHIPPDAGNLIEQLLQYDPEDRIPLHAICQHPWIKRMWGQLKRHYYSVYPNAAPAAFDFCSPDSTARKHVEDALSAASGNRKTLLDLREIYPLEATGVPARTDDGCTKKKTPKSPTQSTDTARHVPALLSFPSPAAAHGTSHGLTAAPSTAAAGVDANSLSSCLATTAGGAAAAQYPCKTTAGAEFADANRGSIVPTAQPAVASTEEIGQTHNNEVLEARVSACKNSSQNTSILQNETDGRVPAQSSTRHQRESNHELLPRKPLDSEAVVAEDVDEYVSWSSKTHKRANGGNSNAAEHLVDQQQQERVLHRFAEGGAAETHNAGDRQKEFRASTSSLAAGEKESRTGKAVGSSATASAAPAGGATAAPPAAVSAMGRSSRPRAATLQPTSSTARAVTPPGALPRLRAGRPPATGTAAPPRRRTTATAATIEEVVDAAAPEAFTSRAADTSPASIAATVERSGSSENSVAYTQVNAERSGGSRYSRVFQPLSKIDSGLGSQKQILLSPPMKRSALRAHEPWEVTMSSVGEAEQTEVHEREDLWVFAEENGQQNSSTHPGEDVQQPSRYGGPQEPNTSKFPQQHLNHVQRPMQQRQPLRHRHQQLLPRQQSLEENHLLEQDGGRQGQKLQQPLAQNEERLCQSWQWKQQSQLQNQWKVEEQPLLQRVYASEHDSAAFHQSQPSPALQPQQHLSRTPGCSPASFPLAGAAPGAFQESLQLYHHQIQHLHHQERAQQAQASPGQQTLSAVHNRQLQPHPNESFVPEPRPPLPFAAWYFHAQEQHIGGHQQLSLKQKHLGSEQQALLSFPQAVSPHRQVLRQQLHILQQQQQTFNRLQHVQQQQQQPVHKHPLSQHLQPSQTQLEYLQHHQQRQQLGQDKHVNSLSPKEVAMNLACRSVQQQEPVSLLHQTGPHQQSRGQQHYTLEYQQQPMRCMTPPASSALQGRVDPADFVRLRNCKPLSHQRNIPWHAQASAYTHAELIHPEDRTVPFYYTTGAEEQPQRDKAAASSPACTVDGSVACPVTRERTQSASVSNAIGTASTDVAAAGIVHPVHTVVAPSKEDAKLSCDNLGTRSAEMSSHDAQVHNTCAPCDVVPHGAGDCTLGRHAESATTCPAATSADKGTVTKHQRTCPERACTPRNALHAYTPRWGRSRQVAADHSVTVAPPSLLSPVASAARLRPLLAVSAPPRSCAAATVARRQPRGLPSPGNSEQPRHRQQVQQMRPQVRSRTPACSLQQQQRGPHQRGAGALGAAPLLRQETQHSKKEDCSRAGTIEADDVIGTERLSCFSFGRRREMNRRHQGENISKSDLALFSDRLSVGSVHDIGLLSQRLNLPDTDRGGPSPLIPSAKACLVLNKLFENSTPPRPAKASGAKLLARAPAPRTRAARSAVAAKASAATSAAGSRAPDATAAVPVIGSTTEVPTKASAPSPKSACRLRQIGSRARYHAHSPPPRGTATAAVAAAAAAWRARAAERESTERKAPAEASFRVGKMVVSCTPQAVYNPENAEPGGEDGSSRETGIMQSQGRFDGLARSRVGAQGFDISRKTQRVFDLSAENDTSTFLPRNPQTHTAAGRQKYGAGERAPAKGTHPEGEGRLSLRDPATSAVSATPTEGCTKTNMDVHAIRSNGDTNSRNCADGNSSCIASCNNHRPATKEAAVKLLAEKTTDGRSVSPSLRLHTSMPLSKETDSQQQSGLPAVAAPGATCSPGAESCLEQLTCTSTSNNGRQPCNPDVEETCKLGIESGFDALSLYGKQSAATVLSHGDCAQGATPFQGSIQPAKYFMSNSHTSPLKRTDPSSVFLNGQTSNISRCLPGYQFAAAAAVAAAAAAQRAQRPLGNNPVCQRYWSPPCRDAVMAQWRSCSSSGQRPFFSRQAVPKLMASFATKPQDLKVASGRTEYYRPAAVQQVDNPSSLGGAGGSALTSSWVARERQMYTRRQQTPPPAASATGRGMRQATPLWSGTSGGQQLPCETLKPQMTFSIGSINGDVCTFGTAAERRLEHLQSPNGFWGSAATAGVSAAPSAAACHARLVPAHAYSGNGLPFFPILAKAKSCSPK